LQIAREPSIVKIPLRRPRPSGAGRQLLRPLARVLASPRPGCYTLSVEADDGARLFLDDRLVLDTWVMIGRHTVDVALSEKAHLLRVEYHENTGTAASWFHWIPDDGSPDQPVPFEALYHDLK
jgi:hypothetical protein